MLLIKFMKYKYIIYIWFLKSDFSFLISDLLYNNLEMLAIYLIIQVLFLVFQSIKIKKYNYKFFAKT